MLENSINGTFAQQGWQCPICKKIMAPNMCYCIFCASGKTMSSTSTEPLHPQEQIDRR